MKQTLTDFIHSWNQSHKQLIFSVAEAPIIIRPTSIDIRYSAAKYRDFLSAIEWSRLKKLVEAKSHGIMYVVTDDNLFERGIIEIKVASSNHNFQERLVVGVLRWIGEEFFPQRDNETNQNSYGSS